MKKRNQDVSTTPSWVVELDDDEDEEDPEFYGAPAFESRLTPEGYKETTRHNPRAMHKNFRKHVLESTLSLLWYQKFKVLSTNLLSLLLLKEENKIIGVSKFGYKVVSVKEYLMHKLEPREDVLSPIISKAMSPKRALGDMGAGPWAQKFIIYSYIGLVAQVENEVLLEEEMSSTEEIALMNKRRCYLFSFSWCPLPASTCLYTDPRKEEYRAEIILYVVVEGLLAKLRSTVIEDHISLERGFKEGLMDLLILLTQIQLVLSDVEKRQVSDEFLRSWSAKLRDVAYDIDDVLDEFGYKILEFLPSFYIKLMSFSFPLIKSFFHSPTSHFSLICKLQFILKHTYPFTDKYKGSQTRFIHCQTITFFSSLPLYSSQTISISFSLSLTLPDCVYLFASYYRKRNMVRKKDRFWEHVEKQNNGRFKCKYCESIFAGGATRIKYHLAGAKGHDINICTKVPKEVQEEASLTFGEPNKKLKGASTSNKDKERENSSTSISKDDKLSRVFEKEDRKWWKDGKDFDFPHFSLVESGKVEGWKKILDLSRTELSSAVFQNSFVLRVYRAWAIALLGLGLRTLHEQMGLAHRLLGPTIAPQNPAVQPLGWKGGFGDAEPLPTAQSIWPINNAGGSSSVQEMHRSMRQFFVFALDAFLSFGYPKRAFNDHYLRDYFNSAVCFDGVEKRNRRVCVGRFLWRSEPIKCLPLHPLYKKEGRRIEAGTKCPCFFLSSFTGAILRLPFLVFPAPDPSWLESEDHTRPWFCPWAPMLNGPGPRIYWARKLRVHHVRSEGWGKRALSATKAPCPSETPDSEARAKEAQIQENIPVRQRGKGVSPSFSQNPKQVLVMPDFWYVRRRNFRHQRRLPCSRQIFAGAPQLPAPCTFSVDGVSLRLESEDYAMPWFCPKPSFPYPGSWFLQRLESVDHAMPWFCPKPSFPHPGSWFPQRLESVDHAMPWFCPKPSFPHPGSWFPQRLESVDHAMPWFCPKPSFPHPGSWFPQRLESVDHAMPWFCPKPSFLFVWDLGFRGVSSSAKPLEFIHTINTTKCLVCSLRGTLALRELAPQPSP
uniref:BED-type domain-containing protein n=1 Tax=Quercus lobata TaxID=97700 RepID=A0A7N2MTV7_QUELO